MKMKKNKKQHTVETSNRCTWTPSLGKNIILPLLLEVKMVSILTKQKGSKNPSW